MINKLINYFRKDKKNKDILFILGCQRSGTTMLLNIFKKNANVKTYGEFSELSNRDKGYGIRLNPLPVVEDQISNDKEKLIVLKPLVESQNVLDLLGYFKDSKAIWMYRHYKDVALSNLNKWGINNGIKDIAPIYNNEPGNWRSENLPNAIRKTIVENYSQDMNPYDAAALFWYVRNSLYVELGLDKNKNVMLCNYDSLVENPKNVFRLIYKFLSNKYPGDKLIRKISIKSVGKGNKVTISPKIDVICNNLFNKLCDTEKELNIS